MTNTAAAASPAGASAATAAGSTDTMPTNPVLTEAQAEVVRATLPAVGANIDAITTGFYRRLFDAHPELLTTLFNRANQARGDQAKALAASVATWATVLVDNQAPPADNLLSRIANKHASLGVTRPQYQVVHDHLFASIVEVLGDAVTPEVADAWEQVYWSLAELLIGAEHDIYAASGVDDGAVFTSAAVIDRVDHGPDAATFTVAADQRVESPGHRHQLGSFLPGQYVSVGVTLGDGARQLRQYSLHGAPSADRWTFTVKRAGEVSAHLLDRVNVGDRIEVTIPAGDFVLDTGTDDPVVLVSAGVGVTPILGLINHLRVEQPGRSVRVVHGDRSPADQVLGAELVEAVDGLADSSLTLWFEHGADTANVGEEVTVNEGLVDLAAVAIADDATVYLCGPEPFLVACLDTLAARGIGRDRLRFELFTPNDWLLD